jgi:hypothetical protein
MARELARQRGCGTPPGSRWLVSRLVWLWMWGGRLVGCEAALEGGEEAQRRRAAQSHQRPQHCRGLPRQHLRAARALPSCWELCIVLQEELLEAGLQGRDESLEQVRRLAVAALMFGLPLGRHRQRRSYVDVVEQFQAIVEVLQEEAQVLNAAG